MLDKLVAEKVIELRPTKDGFTLYKFGERPASGNTPSDVLGKMGL